MLEPHYAREHVPRPDAVAAAARCYNEAVSVKQASGMSQKEIMRLVNLYIGVEAGYLGDFTTGRTASSTRSTATST